MHRQEKLNELLREELAMLIAEEIPMESGFITISYVDCSPDMNSAQVGVSVLPFHLNGTALRALRKNNSLFSKLLVKRTRIRRIPRFNWVIDDTEKNAADIEEVIRQIKAGERLE